MSTDHTARSDYDRALSQIQQRNLDAAPPDQRCHITSADRQEAAIAAGVQPSDLEDPNWHALHEAITA